MTAKYKNLRDSAFALAVITIIVGLGWFCDVIADRAYKVEIVLPAPLLSISPVDYPKVNPVLLTLKPGSPVKVLRMRYGKDFQTFRVETSEGIVGWIIGGEEVKVLPN
jgi:hypothetical protein